MDTTTTTVTKTRHEQPASLAQRIVQSRLARIEHGTLEWVVDGVSRTLGREAAGELSARIVVKDARFFSRVVRGGALGAAESFMDGDWTTDDLTSVVRLLLRNQSVLGGMESGLARLGGLAARAWHAVRRNTRSGSRRNIAAHYDLGNDFFERMLDPTMTYSSAIFPTPSSTLEEASRHKLDVLCRKLQLTPEDHLLEIGTGWGSMAIHAAENYGGRVTTTTISEEQHRLASRRVREAGLADRVTVLKRDYRDLQGQYDKIVSVEMIEAVGAEYYDAFFAKCADLLAPGGLLAMQAITIADQNFEQARREADFIKRYIFPGSCIPSVTALQTAATRSSDLRLRGLEDFSPHYARTLAAWRDNLAPHQRWVTQNYGEQFWRMWDYYLGYCEGGFAEGYISSVHLVFERPRWGLS